jgi:hypothetical protein
MKKVLLLCVLLIGASLAGGCEIIEAAEDTGVEHTPHESPYSAMQFTGMDIVPDHDGNYHTYTVYNNAAFVAEVWEALRFDEWTERDERGGGMIVIEFVFYADDGSTLTAHLDPNDVVSIVDTENPFVFHDDGTATLTPKEHFNIPAGTYAVIRALLLEYNTEHG